MTDQPITREEFVKFVRAARMGVLATVDAHGNPEAALLGLVVTEDGELIFDTEAATRKVVNLAGNPKVALVIGWQDDVSIQVEGLAQVLAGDTRAHYGRIYLEQFPQARALHDGFLIVRVMPCWLRYYDARPETYKVVEGHWDCGSAA